MRVNSLKELESVLNKKIQTALQTEVKEIVRDVIIDHIFTDVYDVYDSAIYWRRLTQTGLDSGSPFDDSENTGLLDPNNLRFTFDGKGGMIVENITLGSRYYYEYNNGQPVWKISKNAGKYIAPIIESGNGYDVFGDTMIPRPFMKNSYKDLKVNHYHTQALKLGLQKQGLEVK